MDMISLKMKSLSFRKFQKKGFEARLEREREEITGFSGPHPKSRFLGLGETWGRSLDRVLRDETSEVLRKRTGKSDSPCRRVGEK